MSFWLMVYEPKEDNEHFFHDVTRRQNKDLPPCFSNINDQALWLYTTGSTGEPKGVIYLQTDMEEHLKTTPRSRFTKGFRETAA